MIAFLSVVVVGCECDDLYALLHFHCTWEMGKRRGRSSGLLRGWRANGGFVWRIPQTGTIESLFSSYFVMDISIGKRLLLQPHKMRARSGTAPQRNTKASPPPRPIRFLLFRLLLSSSPFTFATPGSSHAILPNRKIELEGTKKKKGKKERNVTIMWSRDGKIAPDSSLWSCVCYSHAPHRSRYFHPDMNWSTEPVCVDNCFQK